MKLHQDTINFDQAIHEYFSDIMSVFNRSSAKLVGMQSDHIADDVFDIITSRKYTYLSKKQAEKFKSQFIEKFNKFYNESEPVHFFYDIGGGYGAAIDSFRGLNFEVGLNEIFVLFQIKRFIEDVQELYRPGAKFTLVVDNIAANKINNIPIADTEMYVERFRDLIIQLNMSHIVNILAESETFDLDAFEIPSVYEKDLNETKMSEVEYNNIVRFLGRRCSIQEAKKRKFLYTKVIEQSDRLLNTKRSQGIYITQRSTENTLGFRAFPGSDSRIQCGCVAITQNKSGNLHPILITCNNVGKYEFHDMISNDINIKLAIESI